MLHGIGIDILEKERFKSVHSLSEFLTHVCNPDEIAQGNDNKQPHVYWARVFTCKEAVFKACAIGLHFGSFWHDIIINKNLNAILRGAIKRYIAGDPKIVLSHARSKRFAVSCAIIYK